jgi:iron complex transport system substrate-binding protein
MWRFPFILILAAAMGGCIKLAPPDNSPRIVSVDYCADQAVLTMVDRRHLAAVSVDVRTDPGFALPSAAGLPQVRADVERVLALRPTMVVRSYGGGPRFTAAMERAGIRVVTLPYANTLDEVRTNIITIGAALHAPDNARAQLLRLDTALAIGRGSAIRQGGTTKPSALYITPGDVTTGPGSLIAQIMEVTGFQSYSRQPGWHRLPVEQIVQNRPDIIVRGFFDSPSYRQDRWSSAAHNVVRRTISTQPVVDIAGSDLACGNWRLANAITKLNRAYATLR